MKVTRRILVAMLALAMVVASFAFMASAEEEKLFSTPGIDEIEDILEFYECEVYVNNELDFYDDTVAPVEGTVDEVESVVQIPGDASAGYTVILTKSESKMIFEFSVYLSSGKTADDGQTEVNLTADESGDNSTGKPVVRVSADDYLLFDLKARLSNGDLVDSSFTSLFRIDMIDENPAFKYSVWNADEGNFAPDTVALEGIAPAVDTWYNVVLVFNAENGSYSFSVMPEGDENSKVETPEISLGDKSAMEAFRLVGEFANYNKEAMYKSASFKTRNVEIYAGSFVRDIDKRAKITADTITDLATLYDKAREAGDTATCIRIAEVYNALGQNDSFDDSMINNSEAVYNYSYAQAFVVATGAIDAADTYANRREAVANIDRYKSFVPEDNELFDSEGKYIQTDGIDETLAKELQKARVALEKERATLDAIRQNSVVFIEILLGQTVETPEEGDPIQIPAYNYAWVDFDREILPYYERLNLLFDDESKKPDFTYTDETHDMADVLEAWEDLENKISFAESNTKEFKSYVDILNNTESSFGTRYYDGYLPARALLEELKANECFDIYTHAELSGIIAIYNTNEEAMAAEEEKCKDFIRLIGEASLATYYTVLLERLDLAAQLLDTVQDEYEGITAAKEVYATLREATLKDKGNADAYIEKVDVAKATFESKDATFAQKQAALAAATALKSLGNIYGYEGVSEANVALSQIESALAFIEGNSITLVSLVNQLAGATTFSERRAIIRLANEAAANSEDTYEGVAAAKATLQEAVAAFNKSVETANTALADASVNAASVAAALSGNASIYKTASIIQDYAK